MSDVTPSVSNPFKLVDTRATKLTLTTKDLTHWNPDELMMDFRHLIKAMDPQVAEENSRIFMVKFHIKVRTGSESFYLETIFDVVFQTAFPITKEYMDSTLIKVNAPAIAYPFARSFITTVAANAGYDSIYLPSVNFVKVLKADSAAPQVDF